ncbi:MULTISPECIES: hypothetical protein [Burkholderia]|uniref:hypothetical protein n=1 Tax=Burkholderia TaxID=32008 RepID=UPI0015C5E481|nr:MULTISPECIES: hypothetical protein [Burkholderia]MBY4726871.1 hypothetical protein [Burkholderia contaminans]MCI3967783.1 hypothetical protein [Burkholderia sp. HI4860]MDN7792994.1 hypothetical protein [Burkholderia contaminans]
MQSKLCVFVGHLSQGKSLTFIVLAARMQQIDRLERSTDKPSFVFPEMSANCRDTWSKVFVKSFLVAGQFAQPTSTKHRAEIPALVDN